MRSPTNKTTGDHRTSERRSEPSLPVKGERRVVEQRDMGTAMSDALEDILKWERASERALRIARVAESESLPQDSDAHARSN